MDADDPIAEGLAAIAVTIFEMGETKEVVADRLVGHWEQVGSPEGLFLAAAEAVRRAPQPVSESPERIARMRSIRERLGVQSAEEQLMAALDARQLLIELAEIHG